jgi:Thymidylate synthase
MHVIQARNVNDAFASALEYLEAEGIREESRNGPVIVAPGPVCTVYSNSQERVLFSPLRDANPFFHFFESLHMLAGRNDVAFLAQFVPSFAQYSDDGETQNGAYGYRWRDWFGYDQLDEIVNELTARPESRRAVLTMWDATKPEYISERYWQDEGDLLYAIKGGKDAPCNTQAYFDLRGGKLNMTVLCRSNDIVLGCFGANAVHFSFLLEYLAARLGTPIGVYRQFSNNFHYYTNLYAGSVGAVSMGALAQDLREHDFYTKKSTGRVHSLISSENGIWMNDLNTFLQEPSDMSAFYTDPLFPNVAVPMYAAWNQRKKGWGNGINAAQRIMDGAWRKAVLGWIVRREEKKNAR